MLKELPLYEKVFFVHYICDDFNEGEKIHSLNIYAKDEVKEFSGNNEAENILMYSNMVNKLQNAGLRVVHWNQNKPHYGQDHINQRYMQITNQELSLNYEDSINLASYLIEEYGDNYISHPRLNALAELNGFTGSRSDELGSKTLATNRVLLLSKIYFNDLRDELKTENTQNLPSNYIESNKKQSISSNSDHPAYDPNLWNVKCFDLFKYLHDNYYRSTKRQLTNIWFYLKDYEPDIYTLKCTKDEYILFIKEYYGDEIKNFDKAPVKYSDKELPSMDDHRINFEDSLK